MRSCMEFTSWPSHQSSKCFWISGFETWDAETVWYIPVHGLSNASHVPRLPLEVLCIAWIISFDYCGPSLKKACHSCVIDTQTEAGGMEVLACSLGRSRCWSLNPAVWRLHSVALSVYYVFFPLAFKDLLMGPTTPTISSQRRGTRLVLLGTVKQCLLGSKGSGEFL